MLLLLFWWEKNIIEKQERLEIQFLSFWQQQRLLFPSVKSDFCFSKTWKREGQNLSDTPLAESYQKKSLEAKNATF